MSFQEKRIFVTMSVGLIILISYCVYALNAYQSGKLPLEDMKAWSGLMLWFVVAGIVATIITQIVFHILLSIGVAIRETIQNGDCDEKGIEHLVNAEMVTDEMDQLIELKSMRVGFVFAGIGFLVGLITQVLDQPPAIFLNVIFIAFSLGSLLEGVTQIYFYRRGV